MRPGEAVTLDVGDVDLDAALVTVHGKYDRTRLVPLHPGTVAMLRRYRERCRHLCPAPSSPAFFLSAAGSMRCSPSCWRSPTSPAAAVALPVSGRLPISQTLILCHLRHSGVNSEFKLGR